jgi:Putative Zn-dependent protease, contains TPR repeats
MRPRYIFLIASILICIMSIAVIMVKGNPKDMANLDSIMEIGEGVLHSVDKVGRIATSISDNEEMEIGDKIHKEAVTGHMAEDVKDALMIKYVNEVGNRVAENVKRKDIKYKFHVIEGFYPNAFSAPGGHIYITSGLLSLLKSESELAAILAHEITHVDAKHCIGMVQYKIKTEKLIGPTLETIAGIGYKLFLRPGFTEVQETEADEGEIYLLVKGDYHPMAAVHAFERVDKTALTKAYNAQSVTPIDDTLKATAGMIGRYFTTHPESLGRIDKIKRYISNHRYITESSRFYIGQRNYKEKISCKVMRYREEFKKDYVIKDEKKEALVKKEEPKKEERVTIEMVAAAIVRGEFDEKNKKEPVNEVYTGYGKISAGMTIDEVEIKLPTTSRAFKREDRMGYNKINIYDFDNKGKSEEVGLWIDLDKDKVKGIRIVK